MNLIGKIQTEYESLWKQIVRPSRAHYSEQSLGPKEFALQGEQVQRFDFDLKSIRQDLFQGSLWLLPKFEKSPCVIYLHSSTGNRTEGMQYLGKLIKNGISLCTFDFCGCGNAEGDFVTMGHFQQHQINQVIDYIKSTGKVGNVCLWGRQMGAVSALQVLATKIEVKATILDCPFRSLKSLVEEQLRKQFKLPSFLLGGAVKLIAKTIQEKAGFDIQNVNPCKFTAPGLFLPAFFIFVENEEGLQSENDKKLFEAYAATEKKFALLPEKETIIRGQEIIDKCLFFLSPYLMADSQRINSQKQFDFFEASRDTKTFRNEVSHETGPKPTQNLQESKKNNKDYSLKGIFSFFSQESRQTQPEKSKKAFNADIDDSYNQVRSSLSRTVGENFKKGREDSRKIEERTTLDSTNSIDLKKWVYVSID